MTTTLYTHSRFLDHDTGHGHPERAERIEAVNNALTGESWASLKRREASRATNEQLVLGHYDAYVKNVFELIPNSGYGKIDEDTVVSPASGEAARRAAGAIIAAIDDVMTGQTDNAFCAVRPPGHHAERGKGMGFCLFNNVVIGANYARTMYGLRKIAIVDFDVHHGNGTQTSFWNDPDTFFASTHQFPHYPGTGAETETGVGNILNVPLDANADGKVFKEKVERKILPAIKEFEPEILLISAGFDAHAKDPLASLKLEETDFEWITNELMEIAAECAEGRLISTLEGGYDIDALASSVQAHVGALIV